MNFAHTDYELPLPVSGQNKIEVSAESGRVWIAPSGRTHHATSREKTKQSTENVPEDPLENAPVKFP
jgi:hypothetical protein